MVERKPLVLDDNNDISELPAGDTISGASGGSSAYTIITSNTTAVSGDKFAADVSGGTFTVTLPLNPNPGDNVTINDFNRVFCTTSLTVDRNGQNIEGEAEDLILNLDGATAEIEYVNIAKGWKVAFKL